MTAANLTTRAATVGAAAIAAWVLYGGLKMLRGKVYDLLIVQLTTGWYREVLGALPPKCRLLDVGIGTGQALINNSQLLRAKDIAVVGIDYDADYVDSCTSNIRRAGFEDRISVHYASVYDFVPSGMFDAVYFSASLMIMPDPVAALRHTARFLRASGRLYVTQTVQTRPSWLVQVGKPLLKFVTTVDFGAVTYEADLLRAFAAAGLRVETTRCLSGSSPTSVRSYRYYELARL
ncbi:hypothetical protein ACHHYP_08592 [Achlya hypogyna]|uniref:Methyltransferase domain-containing protein n=1 Tax=Achlya hypogyna TaxID=1202772 RepID=A0A1V9ZKC8_ACHHY|nr:hypothetical protein ACHHYP_08592 [Achlya hypogyna]